jgi:hypothetical protein
MPLQRLRAVFPCTQPQHCPPQLVVLSLQDLRWQLAAALNLTASMSLLMTTTASGLRSQPGLVDP